MSTEDISRSTFSRAKRYAAVHMQQGRVLTDADVNAGADINLEDMRLTRLGVIGPFGSADEGLRVTGPTMVSGKIDFNIGDGTLYLGGHRIELLELEKFSHQSDWLNNPGVAAPGAVETRIDLVYVTVWMQPVSAVEDAELIEAALGGPDTATRLRPVARVMVMPGVGEGNCEDAWAALRAELAADGLGTVNDEMRLVPDAKFTITFAEGEGGDLCSPEVVGGYLGAENRSIRAMLVGDDRFIWGFDNAAPLYRVQLEDNGETVRFLTEPKDVDHWPASGQTVEIIPWGAVLSNDEKLADEAEPGHFALVETAYDADAHTITLTSTTAVPNDFGTEWEGRTDADDLRKTRYGLSEEQEPYYFLRIWDRGAEVSAEPTLPLSPAPAALGTTGLRLEVSGADQRPGDHCIIAARPATPDRVMPWELLAGRAPHGIESFVAPLALLRWEDGEGEVVHDCRPRFRPLTHIRDCCTYTVGDGELSHGDFETIQDAINALPPTGGQVCVLPGVHEGRVVLDSLNNIKLSGCGRRSLIVPPNDLVAPLLKIVGGSDIHLSNLGFAVTHCVAIEAAGLVDGDLAVTLNNLKMDGLDITCRDAGAIDARLINALELSGSRIVIDELADNLSATGTVGKMPGVFLMGDNMLIAKNIIVTKSEQAIRRAPGGLQIGGGSDHVHIRDNTIRGGNGNGITLGHMFLVDGDTAKLFAEDYGAAYEEAEVYAIGFSMSIGLLGCLEYTPPGTDDETPEPPLIPISGGDLNDVIVRDNAISSMQLSGIATPLAFLAGKPVIVSIASLKIDGNTIKGSAQLLNPALPIGIRLYAAFGGICLASVELAVIMNNRIEGNGRNHLEPTCGVYLLSAETVVISDNQIVDNGPRIDTDQMPKPGMRGGIVIVSASPHPSAHDSAHNPSYSKSLVNILAASPGLGLPAVMVHNNMVQQPLGKALTIFGFGHMSIEANHLASQGTTTRSIMEALFGIFMHAEGMSGTELIYTLIDQILGSAVTVLNMGLSSEIRDFLILVKLFKNLLKGELGGAGGFLAPQPEALKKSLSMQLRNGELQFNNNAVVQNFLDGEPSMTLSAGFLASFDDLSVANNTFSSQVDMLSDYSMFDLLALGWSVRCTSNRFEETIMHSQFSASTLGLYNTTAHNQGTHCFKVTGAPALTTDGPNHSLIQMINPLACGGCLKPPFQGLKIKAVKAGKQAELKVVTMIGFTGVLIDDFLVIKLDPGVDEIELTFAGEGATIDIISKSDAPEAEIKQLQILFGEKSITLTGTNIERITIKALKNPAILTRVCADRPNQLSGTSLGGFDAIAFGG